MQSSRRVPIRNALLAAALWAALPQVATATGSDPAAVPPVELALCFGAIASNDDDRIIADCAVLIGSDKADKADRLKALIVRAGVWQRKDLINRAIDDYSEALRLDQTVAVIFNARGELWRKKGDRPKALSDFGASLRLNP